MNAVIALDSENFNPGNRIKGKEVAKGSTVGNLPRKGLVDISNLPPPNHDMGLQPHSPNTKEYIQKLHQENASLHKLLAERTKIIQLQVIELQKFKTVCQQVQQKNLHLAQTNSLMLEELNSAKDRLKVLQHELGCKNGLLTARNLESEGEPTKCGEVGKLYQTDNKNNGPRNKKRMGQSKSLENNSVKPVKVQEKIDERRRQSNRFKTVDQVPTNNLLEISGTVSNLTNKPTQHQNKVDEKRHCSRRQPTRFKVGEEEPTAMVGRSDTLDPTTVELVPAEHLTDGETNYENKVDAKRRCSRRQPTIFKVGEEETTAMVGRSDTLDPTTVELVPAKRLTDEETSYENKVNAKRCRLTRQSSRLKVEEEEPTATAESSDTLDAATNEIVSTKMKIDDNRLCLRRQSASFRRQEEVQETTGDSSQMDNVKVTVSPLHECDPSLSVRMRSESAECISGSEDSELRRTSIRPKRQATEKVQSYKEIPVNVKMRRTQ